MHKIFNIFKVKKIVCKHSDINTIFTYDKIYDRATDNDDYGDMPTYLKVVYCKNCGKIISMEHVIETPYLIDSGFWGTYSISSYNDLMEFYKITGINWENLTMFSK